MRHTSDVHSNHTATGRRETYPVAPELLPAVGLREGRYEVGFARNEEQLDQVLRLRFEVFNRELGEGLEESWETGLDRDPFDAVCHHLTVREVASGEVVGCYRLQTTEMARTHRGLYSEIEYDLSSLPAAVMGNAVELGRACVARAHRSTQVLFLLWKGLALYVANARKRYFFGCSSLTSQDPRQGLAMLRYLESAGHMHPELRVEARPEYVCHSAEPPLEPLGKGDLPTLFRIYLRHGAKVCSLPAIDREFKTIDFLMLFDVDAIPRRMFRMFFGA